MIENKRLKGFNEAFFVAPAMVSREKEQVRRLRTASLAAYNLIRFGFRVLAVDIDAVAPVITVAHSTHCRLLEESAWPAAVEMDRNGATNRMVAGYNGCEVHWFEPVAHSEVGS